jgi:pimeloyl-ACP methyl ester carboxylesterase
MPFFLKKMLFAASMAAALACHLALPAPAVAQAAPVSAPTRFTVTVEGNGPDVILIPGLTSSRQVWDQAIASLGGHYRVHLVQVAGFGGTPARGNAEGPVLPGLVEELHAYIAANHLRRPAIVGHSVGGLITLMLAAGHPDDVGKAMVVDALPFYALLFSPQATVAAMEPQAAQIRDAVAAMSDDAWRAQQTATSARLATTTEGRARLVADSMAADRSVVARMLYEDAVTDMRPALVRIRAPLTIVYAVSPVASEAEYGALVRSGYAGVAGARFVPVERSLHFIMLDQPTRFAAVLGAFLSGHANN